MVRGFKVTTFLKGIMLWTVGALAIMIPLSRATLPHYQRLTHGVRTNGVVTALEPATIRQFATHSEWPTKSIRAQGE